MSHNSARVLLQLQFTWISNVNCAKRNNQQTNIVPKISWMRKREKKTRTVKSRNTKKSTDAQLLDGAAERCADVYKWELAETSSTWWRRRRRMLCRSRQEWRGTSTTTSNDRFVRREAGRARLTPSRSNSKADDSLMAPEPRERLTPNQTTRNDSPFVSPDFSPNEQLTPRSNYQSTTLSGSSVSKFLFLFPRCTQAVDVW